MKHRIKFTTLVLAGAGLLAAPAMAQQKAASKFVPDAIACSLGEIELGKLAEANGNSEDVKAFGRTLVEDHTKAVDALTKVATDMKMQVPKAAKPDARRMAERMQKVKGAQFDKQFVQHMVADHKKDIRAFQQFADSNKGAAADTARTLLPTLQQHLHTAQKLANGSAASGASAGAAQK